MNILLVLIALFLVAHGLIHILFAPASPPKDAKGWPFQINHSWLLAPLGLDRFARPIGMGLVILTVLGFILTGLGLLGVPLLHESWETLALVSAALSFLLLVLFWNRSLVVGVAIDVVIVVAVLWNQSPLRELAQSIRL